MEMMGKGTGGVVCTNFVCYESCLSRVWHDHSVDSGEFNLYSSDALHPPPVLPLSAQRVALEQVIKQQCSVSDAESPNGCMLDARRLSLSTGKDSSTHFS